MMIGLTGIFSSLGTFTNTTGNDDNAVQKMLNSFT